MIRGLRVVTVNVRRDWFVEAPGPDDQVGRSVTVEVSHGHAAECVPRAVPDHNEGGILQVVSQIVGLMRGLPDGVCEGSLTQENRAQEWDQHTRDCDPPHNALHLARAGPTTSGADRRGAAL